MNDFFFVKVTNPVSYLRINNADVNYIQTIEGKVEIVLDDERILVNRKLIELEDRLNELGIVRVSRDTMVPIFKIQHIIKNEVQLINTDIPPIKISRQYKKELVDLCRVYLLAP